MREQFRMYEPASRAAFDAVDAFLDRMAGWDTRRQDSERALRQECQKVAGAKPLGFVSKDALNMSVVGVVFDKAPATGFVPAPASLSGDAQKSGAAGLTYLPDASTPAGKGVLARMIALSSVHGERPLLKVDGVSPVKLVDRGLVLAGAVRTEEGARIVAHPASVKPGASVVPVRESVAELGQPDYVTPRLLSRQRPSPFDM